MPTVPGVGGPFCSTTQVGGYGPASNEPMEGCFNGAGIEAPEEQRSLPDVYRSPAPVPVQGVAPQIYPGSSLGGVPYQTEVQKPPTAQAKEGFLTSLGGLGRVLLSAGPSRLPLIGQVLNGVHMLADLRKGLVTWFDPSKSSAEKRRILTDMLVHGLGTLTPFTAAAAGGYDMLKGGSKIIGAAKVTTADYPVPPYAFDDGGYPRVS
jgi:hypothetical protein